MVKLLRDPISNMLKEKTMNKLKIMVLTALCFLLCGSMSFGILGDEPIIKLNNQIISFDTSTGKPILANNEIIVPIEPIMEAIGGETIWDASTGELKIRANNEATTFDSNINFLGGKAYMPIKMLMEKLDYYVTWDPEAMYMEVNPHLDLQLIEEGMGYNTYLFEPIPEAGFYWGGCVRIPHKVSSAYLHINGIAITSNDSNETLKNEALTTIERKYKFSESMSSVMLVPMFPMGEYELAVLGESTLFAQEAKYKDADIQLLNMVSVLKTQLRQLGIDLENKNVLTGHSGTGEFASRFSILQPNAVKALVIGGNRWSVLPSDNYKGIPLNYPLGTADIGPDKKINRELDTSAFSKIPMFIYTDRSSHMYSNNMNDEFDTELRDLSGVEYVQILKEKYSHVDAVEFHHVVVPEHSSDEDELFSEITSFLSDEIKPVKILTTVNVYKDESIEIEAQEKNVIVIKNTSSGPLEVNRKFLTEKHSIGIIESGTSLNDIVPYNGTTYTYEIFSGGVKLKTIDVESLFDEKNREHTAFYEWEDSVRAELHYAPENADTIINVKDQEGIYERSMFLHGVKYSFIADKAYFQTSNTAFLDKSFEYGARYFHRLYQMYGGFPLDEYKNFVLSEFPEYGAYIFGYAFVSNKEGEDNAFRLEDENYGTLAHEISHAWSGCLLFNYSHGLDTADGWYLEGFNMINEFTVINGEKITPSLGTAKSDLNALLHALYKAMVNDPDYRIPLKVLWGSDKEKGKTMIYKKGPSFIYLVIDRFKDYGLEYHDFLKFTYQKYYIDKVNREDPERKNYKVDYYMNTEVVKEALESFSGLDLSDLFNAYVYGDEKLIIDKFNIDAIKYNSNLY